MSTTHGRPRHFRANAPTTSDQREGIWRAWTDPTTWHLWDAGLSSARLDDGEFTVGARGQLVDVRGRTSRFVVTQADEAHSRTASVVALPAGSLTLTRSLTPGPDGEITHDVAFTGLSAPAFAFLLGRGFIAQVGPSLDALLALVNESL